MNKIQETHFMNKNVSAYSNKNKIQATIQFIFDRNSQKQFKTY